MPIRVTCSCGAQLRAEDAQAGKMAPCPKCGAMISISVSAAVPDRPSPALLEEPVCPPHRFSGFVPSFANLAAIAFGFRKLIRSRTASSVSHRNAWIAVIIGLLLVVLLASVLWSRPTSVEVAGLLQAREQFDGRAVRVVGVVHRPTYQVSKKGNSYTTFELSDATTTVRVFSFGRREVAAGATVRVDGRFYRHRTVGRQSYENEIDATKGSISVLNEPATPQGNLAKLDFFPF